MSRTILLVAGMLCACADPPGEGGLQLYFDVNVDDAASMGLGDLVSFEVVTDHVIAKYDGFDLSLDDSTQTTLLPAVNQLVPGPYYTVPSGLITQLRFFPTLIRFHYGDGGFSDVRLPSGEHTGWKVVDDDPATPDGYAIEDGHVTGVRLFITLGELFHENEPQDWMARPTIRSNLYNIPASGGYDANMLAVVFASNTTASTIDTILNSRGFHVEFSYPGATKLYKLRIPSTMSLQDAHSYLRGFASVLAAAPSVRLLPRLTPSEGLPLAMNAMGAPTGWEQMNNTFGRVGTPAVVAAELSAASGGINTEHPDLWPNIWLNQAEILSVCGTLAQCDPDGDGFVTPKDLNNPQFAGLPAPDSDGNGRITCKDLIAAGSPYVDGVDADMNGFIDDLCGWNFVTLSNDVIAPSCVPTQEACNVDHDTSVAGIMAAAVGTSAGDPIQGPGVGVCWNCRLMPIVIGKDPGGVGVVQKPEEVKGATAEMLAGFLYARDNGAHVANLSSGGDFFRKTSPQHCGVRRIDIPKDDAFDAVVKELDAVVASALGDISGPTSLITLAGGECGSTVGTVNDGIDEGRSDDYYGWPSEAFYANQHTRLISLTVGATANEATTIGPLDTYSNFGEPFEIAAPGRRWGPNVSLLAPGLLCGSNDTAGCGGAGTSFAAPAVAGVAALVASGSPTTFATPNGFILKALVLNAHTIVDPDGLRLIPGNRAITMTNLP